MAYVGTPAGQIDAMRQAPYWPAPKAIAPTLAHDHTALLGVDGAVPTARLAHVAVPTLVMYGGASYAFILPHFSYCRGVPLSPNLARGENGRARKDIRANG